jgi:hypothetical protein
MGPGLLASAGCPSLVVSGDDRTSQVPVEPLCMCATFFDPGGTSTPSHCSVAGADAAQKTTASPASSFISRLYGVALMLPVYAS